jgi:putative acetyltransferase
MLFVRRAIAADAEAIHALHMASIRTLGASHYSGAQLEAWCGERSATSYLAPIATKVVVVAEHRKTVCGFGQLDPAAQEIEAVYVSPSTTRKGIGSAILRELERQALSLLLPRLTLDSSLNAERFYAMHGYTPLARTEHELHPGVFLPCVKMDKVLHASSSSKPKIPPCAAK